MATQLKTYVIVVILMHLRQITITLFLASFTVMAETAPETVGLDVKLFGQPCRLSATQKSISLSDLKTIHKVSPEQLSIVQSKSQAEKLLRQLKSGAALPSALSTYQQLLQKHFEGLRSFYSALEEFKTKRDPVKFYDSVKSNLKGQNHDSFKKILTDSKDQKLSADLILTMTHGFLEFAEPLPEEEFHRSIRRMGIHYQCNFDRAE